jgi:hypothetical protein
MSILNDFHERQISESIESLELERETTAAALHNTEEELAETLTNLDDAILEIHELIHMNNELSVHIQQKPSAECASQTDESVICNNSPSLATSNVQIRDNEAQTEDAVDLHERSLSNGSPNVQIRDIEAQIEVVLDNPSQLITPNGQSQEQKP